ncbi:MAG: HEAT repeat domain-containing protein [Planctomycetota bacterium]|jgi:hypothetical protein
MTAGIIIGIPLACLFPYYFQGIKTARLSGPIYPLYMKCINISLVWFIPACVLASFIFGIVINRLIIVFNNDAPSDEIKLSRWAKYGGELRSWKIILLLILLASFYLYFGQFRPIFYRPLILGKVPALLPVQQPGVRCFACEYLIYHPDRRAVPSLTKTALNDPDLWVACMATGAIACVSDSSIEEPLIKILRSRRCVNMTSTAAQGLGQIKSEAAIEPLIELMNKSVMESWSAAIALGYIGSERALESLENALLNSTSTEVRNGAAQGLKLLGDNRSVDTLISSIRSETDRDVLYCAIEALWHMGDVRVIEILIEDAEKKSHTPFLENSQGYVRKVMPGDFPSIYKDGFIQTDEMREWYERNRNRIIWDKAERKFLLKQEARRN